MISRVLPTAVALLLAPLASAANSPMADDAALESRFGATVHPFLETYCFKCHGKEEQKADLDLSPYSSLSAVVAGYSYWDLVLEKLEAEEMPPAKAKLHPDANLRREVVEWIRTMRQNEAQKNAGDPGPVLARRLSNAEYDYTIRDLTGVDIRPTREFPVDPANQAGFDNSGESLAMSPALLKKYLQAAREVAEHLLLKPDGFEFAPHPVVADTDRDKYSVLRIVDFYKRQPTDYADYFEAAWRYQNRSRLGRKKASLDDIAAEAHVSPKYLATVWSALTGAKEKAGPIAKLQAMWRDLPAANTKPAENIRGRCEQMREYVVQLREKIVPEVKNLNAPPIQNGSQTLVLWKDRQMAANRRRFDVAALHVLGAAPAKPVEEKPAMGADDAAAAPAAAPAKAPTPPSTPDVIRNGGKFLAPAITTTGSSATFQMAASKRRSDDPDLIVPADPAERARYEAAFARFAAIFPDAFYITERARVYLDAEKEQKNAGRLLSAGLHSMTGYFRDDGPLYDLVLDEKGRRELDRMWDEFDFSASVPQRMHTSFVWFERTDSNFMRDAEFDPFRPEDKSVLTPEKIKKLGELYLAKAIQYKASEQVQQAIQEHFALVANNIARVDQERLAAEPTHLAALQEFAERAYRRPLTAAERDDLLAFYRTSRAENGLDHEEAMRDCIVAVLMSPHFCYRIDLLDRSNNFTQAADTKTGAHFASQVKAGAILVPNAHPGSLPLSDYALASRLSYFLWSSMPDAELLAHAAAGDLHQPEVLLAQTRRMLKDTRVRDFAIEFGGNWLDFRRFEQHNAVDRDRFPAFDNELRQAMFEEPVRFLVDLIHEDRPVLNCLYGDYTFVNAPLAKHYGMDKAAAGATADGWVRVDHASEFQRGGLLPMSVFLTANSPGLRTSPVKRGYWVVRRVLGERIPPPPAEVPALPNDEAKLGDLTLRDALARHREDKSCAACHARFDSFGLVFEGFGPVGERRTKDFGGHPVDTRAPFPDGGEWTGLDGLRSYLKAHREADFVDNLCHKLVAYGLGRTLLPSDDALVEQMKTALAANHQRFSSLVECIVASPQFRTKRAPKDLTVTLANR
jgi:hypothetical protein